jgi:predicted RNase H-like nuclease (RuvC/YqgF family)
MFLKNCVCEDEDPDEIKQMNEQINFLKKRIKELESKLKHLEEQVKELIKNVKYEPIIKPQIVQICQVLGYSPHTSQKIISSKISGLKNIIL